MEPKPRRGDTIPREKVKTKRLREGKVRLIGVAPTGLAGYWWDNHRAYALGYICTTPFGGWSNDPLT